LQQHHERRRPAARRQQALPHNTHNERVAAKKSAKFFSKTSISKEAGKDQWWETGKLRIIFV
jgi:hypothetical protein